MNFTADRALLLATIRRAAGGVSHKGNPASLGCYILCEVEGDSFVISGNRFDVSVQARMPVKVKSGDGTACVFADGFEGMLAGLEDQTVEVSSLSTDPTGLNIKAGKSTSFKLRGWKDNADDFPRIVPPKGEVKWVTLPASPLQDLFAKVALSMSSDDTRMMLNGVFFEVDASEIRVTSTDGSRLCHVRQIADLSMSAGTLRTIIHRTGVGEVRKILEGEDQVAIGFGESVILFVTNRETLTVRTIEDGYPNIDRVVPVDPPLSCTLKRARLQLAIRRVALLSPSKTRAMKLTVSPTHITVSAMEPDHGEGRDEIDAVVHGYKPHTCMLSHTYVSDALAVMSGEDVTIGMSGELDPILLQASGDPGAKFVIMPIRP